ncbi:clathrin coat assembly protein AP180-like isoform 5-T5 [Spinachia spinachia]
MCCYCFCRSPTKQDATANNSVPAAAAAAVAPARRAPPTPGGGPPARPGPPAKPPPPSVTPTATAPTVTPISNALDDGFLLDLDPISSSAKGAAATSSTTGWGDLLAEAAPPAADEASEALLAEGESDAADAVVGAPAPPAPKTAATAAVPAAATAATPAPATLPVSAPASAADMDLFGGDGPAAAGPAADAFGGSDPFATTEGSGAIAQELDLFAMMPTDTEASAVTPPTSSEAPTIVAPIAAPAALAAPAAPTLSSTTTTTTTTDTTTTTTTTTESPAAPTLDIFGDMFDSMPEQSPTTESKAATTPSVDLFGADLPAVSRGPSPLPELAPPGDIVTDSFASQTPAAADVPPVIATAAAGSPEASSPLLSEPVPVVDLLDSFGSPVEETQSSAPGGPGDDLLGGLMSPTLAPTAAPALAPALAPLQNNLLESSFDALGSLSSPAAPIPAAVPIVPAAQDPGTTTPVPSGGFDASMFGGLGDLLMPSITPQSTGGSTAGSTAGSIGTAVGGGGNAAASPAPLPPAKTVGGDLDSSLANLIGDLGVKKKDPQSEKKLTGGANWMPHVAPTSWATSGAPMAGAAPGAPGAPVAAMVPPMSTQPGFGMPPASGPVAPVRQSMMGQPMMGQPMMRPPFTGVAGAAPGAPIPPGPASQSPKKPKDPLADLNLKDFL